MSRRSSKATPKTGRPPGARPASQRARRIGCDIADTPRTQPDLTPKGAAMPDHDTTPTTADLRRAAARTEARRAVFQLARDGSAQTVTRPLYHGAETNTIDIEPLAGARAARDIELAAHAAARDYIRQAREAGHDWDRIGQAIGVSPNGDADQAGTTIAEAAYTYAAGSPTTETAIRYGRSVTWRCPSCDHLIDDLGLIGGPADDERGHAQACPRLGAAIAERSVGWEPEP